MRPAKVIKHHQDPLISLAQLAKRQQELKHHMHAEEISMHPTIAMHSITAQRSPLD